MDDPVDPREPVSVEFHLTPEEWTAAAAVHLERSPLLRNAVRQIQVLFVAIWALLAVMQLVYGEPLLALLAMAIGLVATPFLPALTRRSQRSHLRKTAALGLAHGTFGPHRVELVEDGMRDVTPSYAWLTRWSAIDRVEQADDMFLIYTGPQAFLPIPTSAFPDSATLRAFSDRFFRGVGEGRALRDRSVDPERDDGIETAGAPGGHQAREDGDAQQQ